MRNVILCFIIIIYSIYSYSQNPTYEYTLMNDSQLSPNIYEFDIYLKRTGSIQLEVANTQIGLNFNGAIKNGGTLTFSLVQGTSEFLPSQIPSNFSVDTVNYILGVAPRANPGTGNGTIISNTGNGTRLGRFRISNTVPFPNQAPNLSWNFISTGGKYPSRLSAYVNGLATEITQPNFHFLNLTNANLPVQLVSFVAVYNEGGIKLEWTTVSEMNCYGFYVERRKESDESFTELSNSFIAGSGTILEPRTYSFIDRTVDLPGLYYYRLRQVDNDGLQYYSNEISISVTTLNSFETAPEKFQVYQNYPNPFNTTTEIKFCVESKGKVEVVVYNILGQTVATLFDKIAEPGIYYKLKFDALNLNSGVYFYKVTSDKHTEIKKMLFIK